MGIYPTRDYIWAEGLLYEVTDTMSGAVTTTVYQPIVTFTERTDCFCCSCDREGSDPACRNHGYAAKRPCEEHDMPGSPYDDDDDPLLPGVMPRSVQEIRRKRNG